MRVNTTRFGDVEIDKDMLINFSSGIPGHSKLNKYFLIDYRDIIKWLHAVDEPETAFLVTNPFNFFPSYSFKISDDIEKFLGIKRAGDIAVIVLLALNNDLITADLKEPLVINVSNKKASQLVLRDTIYSSRTPLPFIS